MALQHKHDEEEGEERPHHQQGQQHHHHSIDASNCVGEGGDVAGTPKFLPLLHVCSVASPCVGVSGSSNVMSKKVTARKLVVSGDFFRGADDEKAPHPRPLPLPIVHVYTRRLKRPRHSYEGLSELARPVKLENVELSADVGNCGGVQENGLCSKKRRIGSSEVVKLRENSLPLCNGSKLREVRNHINSNTGNRRKRSSTGGFQKGSLGPNSTKKWIRLNFDGVDPKTFVGLQCKVYWPLDGDWYCGHIAGYNPDTSKHHVKYEDGDEEVLLISNEKIKFHASREDMQKLNFSTDNGNVDTDGLDYDEMVAMAANLDDCQDHEAGDIIWAKITGYAMWPAIIMDESLIGDRKGLNRMADGNSVAVQFFGTHDFARVKTKLVISFLRGLLSSLHLKCKKPHFLQSLEEAKLYLSEQKLPRRMLQIRKRIGSNYCASATMEAEVINDPGEDFRGDGKKQITPGLSCSRFDSKPPSCKLSSRIYEDCPVGYRPVRVDWKDLDKCNVCHMDEEYENNLFLQCDKCRMLVHAKCYGEVEPVDGVLWLCNLCRPGAPDSTPLCCLCPVIGGVMKPTVDGRWAHLACAIWIPETCLSDINKMEPIDGLSRISKDRWKLLCSICGVPYGACIQCSNNTCRVAYHPLCARAAGLCAELEDEDRLHLVSLDDVDDENQCIRLLSFCKKHRQPANQHSAALERVGQTACKCSDYVPPLNPSGCARTEPFNNFGRRGRKAPEALAAASLKCLFVENRSYIISGCSQPESLGLTNALEASGFSHKLNMLKASEFDDPKIFSMDDKYKHMRKTFRSRLAFGKSGIHGFGIFAKHPHRAGDMVIEYTGELVRPSVADRREHFIYNSLVGAGTYMFRIDDDRVIDATRAGSIAHLINHSCEPNCYSRGISINGDEHIIIFAKRDIRQWEELTYDYRFFSVDEQLRCHCGFPRCRGIVNDTDAEERNAKLYVPRTKLMDWRGE